MKNGDSTPITCLLTTAELRDREAHLLAQFRSAVLEAEELPEGYALPPATGRICKSIHLDCSLAQR